jgi:hypothetical protein
VNADKWLSRALVASFLVNCLLAVWLWSASRKPENVERATHEYRQARTAYDTTKQVRERAVTRYRTLRDTVNLTDTVAVKEVLARADTVMVRDSVALAAADTALAKADTLIRELRGKKPRRIAPFAEVLYSPFTKEYRGRGGFEIRVVERLHLVAVTDVTKMGTGAAVGLRWTF